ncbi:hypothetical protein SSCG_02933 [Streptomyces clavuligerus]|nr:hypothetical protein SSCG_02933 [Streptomyces clavuligerus]
MRPVPESGHPERNQEQEQHTVEHALDAPGDESGPEGGPQGAEDTERRRRRAQFLRELNEAKALRERVQPRRARAARMRQQMRMRTFRW